MKILIFSPYYPPHIGGTENYVDELNKYLSQAMIDVIVFTPRLPQDSAVFEKRFESVNIIRFPAFEPIFNYPLPQFWNYKFWTLLFRIFSEKPDIIISQTRFFFTSLLALFYAKIKKVPWIHMEHSSDFVTLNSSLKSFVSKLYDYSFGCLIFKLSDINISISRAVQKFILKFDRRNSPVIYRGLNLEEIDKIKPDTEFYNENKIIITFAGRLIGWKGVINSVKAVVALPEKIKSKVVFIIAGDGEEFKKIKKISDNSIVMLGSVSRQKVFSILKSADIFIHSSLPGGGLSTSLLEAMYCGCAIIATPNEGAKEVVINRENGLLIGESNPELIKEKIIELCEKVADRKKYSENASRLIAESFDWNGNAGNYIKYFEKILKNYHLPK